MQFSKTLLFILLFFAQKGASQVVRGRIFDAETGRPLEAAQVVLIQKSDSKTLAAAADSAGYFFIKSEKSGLFQLKTQQIGFETAFYPELELEVGKEKVLEIGLRSTASELPEVEIRPVGNFEKLPSGQHLLSRDAVLKQPAVFADLARLATAFAGVANSDDGANGLSLRGLPPTMTRWQIEGLAVVSPNHLGNAGTVSDRPTTNSGGVTMLSAQLLENSSLLVGPQPARFGGATGGILDLRLRNGNDRRREATISTGLIGLDAAIEGPFSMKKTGANRASFLVNYRYSTVGLLQKLGVSFGNEAIDFQDFSAHLAFPNRKNTGETRFFTILGGSRNHFKNEKDSSAWTFEKDFFEIDFRSKTAVVGLVHDVRFSSKNRFLKNAMAHFAAAWSKQKNDYEITRRTDGVSGIDSSAFSKTDVQFWISKKASQRTTISGGGGIETFLRPNAFDEGAFGTAIQPRWNGWIELKNQLTKRVLARLGARQVLFQNGLKPTGGSILSVEKDRFSFEPTASIETQLAHNQRVAFAFSKTSMVFPFQPDQASVGGVRRQVILEQLNFSLEHEWRIAEKGLLRTALFYQKTLDEPNFFSVQRSVFDYVDWLFLSEFMPQKTGSATTKGLELTFQKFLEKGFFLLANATFFDAKRQTLADGEQPMRFNSRWLSNLNFGKEWTKTKSENRSRTLGANVRLTARGGFFDAPFGVLTGEKLPNYGRLDTRLYWKKNFKKRTGTLALDIQNATNRKNVNYYFDDAVQGKTLVKYGLGLIPILSYRLDFGL